MEDNKLDLEKIEQVEITDVEYPECVRIRPGMYISHKEHQLFEIIDNSVDEYLAGYCKNICIVINKTLDTCMVEDDGRGMPVTLHKHQNKYPGLTQAEVAYTVLHAGGKFSQKEGSYKVATGYSI